MEKKSSYSNLVAGQNKLIDLQIFHFSFLFCVFILKWEELGGMYVSIYVLVYIRPQHLSFLVT